jgi:hypothetical protein
MIHTDGCIDARKLAKIKPVDPPGAGRNWKSVPFKDVAAAMTKELHDFRLKPVNEWFAVSKNLQVMAGVWDCQGGPKMPKNTTLQVGVMAGNDRHTPLTLYFGAGVKQGKASYSHVIGHLKAPGANTIHAVTDGRIAQGMGDLWTLIDGYAAPTTERLLTDNRFDKPLVIASLADAAAEKLFPWSYLKAGYHVVRELIPSPRLLTPAEIHWAFWECLRGTNPVYHLKHGQRFPELAF